VTTRSASGKSDALTAEGVLRQTVLGQKLDWPLAVGQSAILAKIGLMRSTPV
jgi:hypothetical protein